MNLQRINIDRYRIKCWLVVFLSLLIESCTTKRVGDYDAIRAAIPAAIPLDPNKNIALIFYNPEGCPPCNSIVANLQEYTTYQSLFGKNAFIVFPSISPIRLANYDRMLKEYGNVNIGYINDGHLYKLLEQKDKDKFCGKPRWVGLNTTTKEYFGFYLKEVYLPDSIFSHFR